jgi:hypothetical protein
MSNVEPVVAFPASAQAQGDVLYRDANGKWAVLAAGSSGQVLQTSGTGGAPVWTTPGALAALAVPLIKTGGGYYYQPQYAVTTNAALVNGTLRLCPVYIPTSCTIAALFAEFTAAGDAASLLATCIYSDTGNYPGTLLTTGPTISTGSGNAGTVATGGTPGVYGGTVSQAVTPGVYWFGGVLQGVTVTQPTFRTGSWLPYSMTLGSVLPTAGSIPAGYAQTGQTGALPGTFLTVASAVVSSLIPRVGFKVT